MSVKYVSARNHQSCEKCGVMHQVNPQFKPGGRKKLRDGLAAHDATLLFNQTDGFYRKKKAVLLIIVLCGGTPPAPPVFFKFLFFFNIQGAKDAKEIQYRDRDRNRL